jgi:hypothetical protein
VYQFFPSRLTLVEMSINATTGELSKTLDQGIHPFEGWDSKVFHKNWSPFLYNDTQLLLVYFVDPLTIVELHRGPPGGNVATISKFSEMPKGSTNIKWDYGALRGGTGAKRIGKDTYLAFFHSRIQFPCNSKMTYFFGAYIFSTAKMPFRVTHVSKSPIYDFRFYDGPWGRVKHFDYVTFPIDFFFADENVTEITTDCDANCFARHDVILSMGWQDTSGLAVRFNLLELFNTMVATNA